MDWKIVSIGEATAIDDNGRFIRSKKVRFTVNKSEHTLRISMVDFDRGKTNELVKAEAEKVIAAYSTK